MCERVAFSEKTISPEEMENNYIFFERFQP